MEESKELLVEWISYCLGQSCWPRQMSICAKKKPGRWHGGSVALTNVQRKGVNAGDEVCAKGLVNGAVAVDA